MYAGDITLWNYVIGQLLMYANDITLWEYVIGQLVMYANDITLRDYVLGQLVTITCWLIMFNRDMKLAKCYKCCRLKYYK